MNQTAFIKNIKQFLSAQQYLTQPAECQTYTYDNGVSTNTIPCAVLFPETTEQVQLIVQSAYAHEVPITCRGRGTGTAGGSVPINGGAVISFEQMQKIIEIDVNNRTATVQPGVTNQELQDAVKEFGFMWAPDPSSAAFCSIGGNLAYGSAGPRAVKYDTTRENTLALTAVTGTGEIIHTGAATTKTVVGYDLTRLLVGSEGTLAVITQAILKLKPLAECKQTIKLEFDCFHAATQSVCAIMAQTVTPCALEFIDEQSINMIKNYSDVHCDPRTKALLMIEVDGFKQSIDANVQAILGAAQNPGLINQEIAQTSAEVKALWAMRKALSPALKHVAPKKINEDVVVPVSRMPELINGVTELCAKYAIKNANFGHAGNGNIHVNLLVNPDEAEQLSRANQCLDEIFSLVLNLNGSISGEHGIGTAKQAFIERELGQTQIELMKGIKRCFDPKNILNPGKVWLST